MKNILIIFVTCATSGEARRIAARILEKRLGACANIMRGVESRFWWKGRIDNAREVLLMVKTTAVNFKKIEKEVKRLHSYDVPEIIAVPIVAGSREYLEWIKGNVRKA